MQKVVCVCDRCGANCGKSYGYRVYRQGTTVESLFQKKYIPLDLCQECTYELNEWMENKGRNKNYFELLVELERKEGDL